MKEQPHPEPSTLEALVEGHLTRSERRQVARHLKSCGRCRAEMARLSRPRAADRGRLLAWQARRPATGYGEAVGRALEGLRALLPRLHEDSGNPYREPAHPEASRWRTSEDKGRRPGPLAVCNLLLEGSLKAMRDRPETARNLAESAIELVEDLLPGSPWAPLLRDVQARGWAYLGYLHQRQEDHEAAEAAFDRADVYRQKGSGDPLEEAQVLQLEALWAESRGDDEEAEWLLDREAALYDQLGQSRLEGRALVQKANLRARQGDLPEAIRLCREGISRLDPQADRELALIARRDLLHYLYAGGRHQEARALLADLTAATGGSGHPGLSPELRWMEGQIAQTEGRLAEAAATLGEAQRGFLSRGEVHQAFRVTLDLAAVLCRWREGGGPEPDPELVAPLLDAPGLSPQERAALGWMERAIAARKLCPELVDRFSRAMEVPDNLEVYLTFNS